MAKNIEKIFKCDLYLVSLVKNKKFIQELMNTICINSSIFAGIYSINTLNNSLIKPKENKANIYFVQDTFQKWCCCIVEMRKNITKDPIMIWYDPSNDFNTNKPLFDINVKNKFINYFESMKVFDLKIPERAQQFYMKHQAQDIFSSWWSIMFVDIYLNNLFNSFARIDFVKWQMMPLKSWINCIINKLPKWKQIIEKKCKNTIHYCRYVSGLRIGTVVVKIPNLQKCASFIVFYYLQNS